MRVYNSHTLAKLTGSEFAKIVTRIIRGEIMYRRLDGVVINRD